MEQNITRLDKGEGRKAQDGRKNLRKEFCCDTFRYDSHDICLSFFFFDFGLRIDVFSCFWFVLITSWSNLGQGWVGTVGRGTRNFFFTSSGGV